MALFIVQHRHPAESCPARDPQMGQMLLQHLSPENASRNGLRIHGEGVVEGGHTLYLIVEAEGEEKVRAFMAPFAQAGTVEVIRANTCAQVVARQSC